MTTSTNVHASSIPQRPTHQTAFDRALGCRGLDSRRRLLILRSESVGPCIDRVGHGCTLPIWNEQMTSAIPSPDSVRLEQMPIAPVTFI